MSKENLRIQYKRRGRSYKYVGQDLSESAWYILTEDDKTYPTYEDYLADQEESKEEEEEEDKEVELTPQQKAAATRAANKAAKESKEKKED